MILANGNEAMNLKTHLYPPKTMHNASNIDSKREINVFYRFNDKVTFISIILAFIVCYIFALGSFGILIYLREQNFGTMMTDLIVATNGAEPMTKFLTYKYDTFEFIFSVITLNLSFMGIILSMLMVTFYKHIIKGRKGDA